MRSVSVPRAVRRRAAELLACKTFEVFLLWDASPARADRAQRIPTAVKDPGTEIRGDPVP